MARNGSAELSNECLILGVKQTSEIRAVTSPFDPLRTLSGSVPNAKAVELVADAPHRGEIARWAVKIARGNCRGRRNHRKVLGGAIDGDFKGLPDSRITRSRWCALMVMCRQRGGGACACTPDR